MAKNKEGRPEWFKFWQRNRRQLDIELLDMKSRGVVFTNMMRYFDSGEKELLEMTPIESMAFNVVKCNVDDSFAEYEKRVDINSENGRKGGRPHKTEANPNNQIGYEETEKTQSVIKNPNEPKKPEDRREKTEERRQNTEDRSQKREERGKNTEQNAPPTYEEVFDLFSSSEEAEKGLIDPKDCAMRFWREYSDTWTDINGRSILPNLKRKVLYKIGDYMKEEKASKGKQPAKTSKPDPYSVDLNKLKADASNVIGETISN